MVVDLVGLERCVQQLLRHARCSLGICARQQQDELVAAQATHRVLVTYHGAQALGNSHQQGIAHLVA